MGAVQTAGPRGHQKKKGKKRKKMRRVDIHIDMTPMVDVAFLLLTFFMLTTSYSRPQTMEINLPPSEAKVEVAESNLLTLRVREDGAIFWSVGVEPPQKVEFSDMRALVSQKVQQNPRLITLIKVDRKGKYHYMVDIIDELNLANVTRFSLAPLLDADKQILQKVAGA